MISFLKLPFCIFALSAALWGQSPAYTYIGDIVNARCLQAAPIVNRNSRGYAPPRASTFNVTHSRRLNTARMRNPILRHCSLNPGVTEFALLDAQGNFLKLDDAGNFKILAKVDSVAKRVRAIIIGAVDREILKVISLETE